MAQLVQCWSSMHEALPGSIPGTMYRGTHTVPCTPEVRGSEGQGHPQLHIKFEASQPRLTKEHSSRCYPLVPVRLAPGPGQAPVSLTSPWLTALQMGPSGTQ